MDQVEVVFFHTVINLVRTKWQNGGCLTNRKVYNLIRGRWIRGDNNNAITRRVVKFQAYNLKAIEQLLMMLM